LPQGGRALDIGCGIGDFAIELEHHDYDADGFDANEEYGDLYGPTHYGTIETEYYSGTAIGACRQDIITAFHVLEHLRDPVAVLRKLAGWLEPEGRIWLEVPDYDHPLNGDVTNEYTYPHLWIFTEKSLRLCMEKAGLTVCETWNETAPYTGRVVLFGIGRAT
jgi:2-polyprenyl-3-methyl-5-hydroxy-6-metoxy-1,4-benzoquinol methylase